jgi:energy-coupling factor transport system substrate-specific component
VLIAEADAAFFRAQSPASTRWRQWLGMAILGATSAIGIVAFLYPFLLSRAPGSSEDAAHSGDAPLIFGLIGAASCALFLAELAGGGMNAKVAGVLAVLATAAAVLRLPPLPAGASAFYALVILGGYVYGPRFGFLLGALSLLMSALPSGGLGPWVPFQMYAAGWLGLSAGWAGLLAGKMNPSPRVEVAALVVFGVLWGFLYGAIINLWFWPYVAAGESVSWQPGMGLGETLQHYWAFYVLTSFGWDIWSTACNGLLIALAGRPLLATLTRFRDRFQIHFGPRAL